MDQHPVPQNISSYEFRLVGDMTLKQFFQLAGGIGLGFLCTKLPLPVLIRWPLGAIFVLLGIMLAFVPVSGRPFSQWLLAFVRAIYSPTEYNWSASPAQPMEAVVAPVEKAPATPLDKIESQVVGRISQLFSNQPITVPDAPPAPLDVTAENSAPTVATETTIHEAQAKSVPESPGAMEPKRPIMIAEIVESPPPPTPLAEAVEATNAPISAPILPVVARPQTVAPSASFTNQMTAPEHANLLAGVVVGASGQPVEGVILEVSDSKNGIPVRALRTNKLGRFQTATPLANGVYNLVAEKDGLTFDPVSIMCENKIIQPLLISAHA